MDVHEQAAALLREHGRRAQQRAIDAIVAAIRAGDETEIARRGAVLRALDAQIVAEASARRGGTA